MLSKKQLRYKFFCADADQDDCIALGEFEDMLDVGFNGKGKATIDALAFATDLTGTSYDSLD